MNSSIPLAPSRFRGTKLWQGVADLPQPANYWRGLRCDEGLTPDNILLFPRSDTKAGQGGAYGHYHPRYVLDVVQGQPSLFQVEDRVFRMEQDDCLLIFPHQFHRGEVELPTQPSLGGWVVITFDLRDGAVVEALRNSPRRLDRKAKEKLTQIVTSYRQGEGGLPVAYYLRLFLEHLLDLPELPASRVQPVTEDVGKTKFLTAVHQFLAKPWKQPILPKLAASLGISESALQRQFTRYTGGSLAEYLRASRLQQALRLLESSDILIADVAARLDFSSVQAFSRAFKAAHGCSPKQYVSLLRKNRKSAGA